MRKTISVLSVVLLLNVGCSKPIDKQEPIYVTPIKYEKLSCKQLKERFTHYDYIPCKELKEKLLLVSPTEYERLSCKQLHQQLIKINDIQDTKSRIGTEETITKAVAAPFLFVTGMWVMIDYSESGYKDYESESLKEAYETLKQVATKKNCSFADELRDIKQEKQ